MWGSMYNSSVRGSRPESGLSQAWSLKNKAGQLDIGSILFSNEYQLVAFGIIYSYRSHIKTISVWCVPAVS